MIKKTGIASIDADTAKLEKLEARSAKATGLVGKLFSLPHADGSAIYTVEEEKGSKVRIVNQPIHDAWQDDILGPGGWFPRKQIEPIIRRQESFAKAMDQAAKRQKSEREQYAEIVGAAALEDLDQKADVYELASWAWKRGQRNGLKDARIMKQGRMPWANDIAAALADSKAFPAINSLNDSVKFIMLADKFHDPIVHRNAPPSAFAVLGAVEDAFKKAVGVVPNGLGVSRPESKYLDSTHLDILNPEGVKVASVCYDAASGKILQVNVGFQVDEKGLRSE
jgi:hypothetical protein